MTWYLIDRFGYTYHMGTKYKGTVCEVRALDAYIKLMRASDSITMRVMRDSSLGNITPSQFAVLEAIFYGGPMCASTLAEKQLKSRGNLTLVIDNLEKNGFVTRIRSLEDRRMVRIHLTDSGRETIASLMPDHVAAITAAMNALTADEQATLEDLCRRLGKAAEPAPPRSH